jgi:hypothetical protein
VTDFFFAPYFKTMYRTIAFVVAVSAFTQNAFSAQFDWPQWQGPDRTAHSKETGLLKSWAKGFEDANSFLRAFQLWEGTSPGEWRTRQVSNAGEGQL